MKLTLAQWVSSTEKNRWENRAVAESSGRGGIPVADPIDLTGTEFQTFDGFGGCFNELGWIALSKTSAENRETVLRELFAADGANLSFCRIPIGASDYAERWYSHDEHDGDYAMEKFSIERDFTHLIPFIRGAQSVRSDLRCFASPWSPPVWMKTKKVYNSGTLRMEPKVLDAYALYFLKFLRAYREAGIPVEQVHVQNEPFADQKFPSCLWTGEEFATFIGRYLGPLFEREGEGAEIWLGTLNGPETMSFNPFSGDIRLCSYDRFFGPILYDERVRRYVSGVGFQWAGKNVIQRTHETFPGLALMQTENECGDGKNSWAYALYVFDLVRHYFSNGVGRYIYWNMVLETGGVSTWGWKQNSLVSIDPSSGSVVFNPEFHVIKHFSHFLAPGAVRVETEGIWSGSSLAFKNPDGSVAVMISNAMPIERTVSLRENGEEIAVVTLAPESVNTFTLESR